MNSTAQQITIHATAETGMTGDLTVTRIALSVHAFSDVRHHSTATLRSWRQLSGAHTAVSWNAAYPVGTAVRYWPIYPPIDGVPPEDTTTRSEAWTLGDGSVVVLVAGKTGGVCLSRVEVLP